MSLMETPDALGPPYLLAKLVYGLLLCLIATEEFYMYKSTL